MRWDAVSAMARRDSCRHRRSEAVARVRLLATIRVTTPDGVAVGARTGRRPSRRLHARSRCRDCATRRDCSYSPHPRPFESHRDGSVSQPAPSSIAQAARCQMRRAYSSHDASHDAFSAPRNRSARAAFHYTRARPGGRVLYPTGPWRAAVLCCSRMLWCPEEVSRPSLFQAIWRTRRPATFVVRPEHACYNRRWRAVTPV